MNRNTALRSAPTCRRVSRLRADRHAPVTRAPTHRSPPVTSIQRRAEHGTKANHPLPPLYTFSSSSSSPPQIKQNRVLETTETALPLSIAGEARAPPSAGSPRALHVSAAADRAVAVAFFVGGFLLFWSLVGKVVGALRWWPRRR